MGEIVNLFNRSLLSRTFHGAVPGRGYSLVRPIQGGAAGQGVIFGLSVLNRVYNFYPSLSQRASELVVNRVWTVRLSSLNTASVYNISPSCSFSLVSRHPGTKIRNVTVK